MGSFDYRRYTRFSSFPRPVISRRWPDRVLAAAPDWCSVDLRDGNQALPSPMSVEQKLRMFKLLVAIGFREIEIGFPAASRTEYELTRALIEQQLIPADVTIQVLTQAREPLIERTFEALAGVRSAIVHVYNSTSIVQREQVFRAGRSQVKQIAVRGAEWVRKLAAAHPRSEWTFEYSPESFTGTETEYALEVCNAVLDVWQPDRGQAAIINLPATVEMTSPNVFADQVEFVSRSLRYRDCVRLSVHTHNDRGCAVAAAELGLMAGADRVEGTLFGNGERTGNTDLVTMALNLYSQGVDPRLDLGNMEHIISVYRECTGLPIHPRHPWVGELVYTAFSGSHQDAIRKSMQFHAASQRPHWQVAYLPIDPTDLGRQYVEVVRINSQSGKGGIALVLERDHGITVPSWLHAEIARAVQLEADDTGKEVDSGRILALFESTFLSVPEGWQLGELAVRSRQDGTHIQFTIVRSGEQTIELSGRGQGTLEAIVAALEPLVQTSICVLALDERALAAAGSDARALASVAVEIAGTKGFGCAVDQDRARATLQAALSSIGRAFSQAPLSGTA